jgi:hypothetical protein
MSDEQMNDILLYIQNELKDITATCLDDLAKVNPAALSTNIVTHEIKIKPNTEPIKQKTRGIPTSFREEFKRTIMEMKKAGLIVNSKSPWCSPVRLVRKKDGTIRVCVDFRKLNNVTIKDAYPIPIIDNLFDYLATALYFTTLDLASGYYQVMMDSNSQEYTAFACDFGFFEYRVMPMGLTNACATFQRLMNNVLDGLIGKICLVYLDDIIIFSNTLEEHIEHVKLVAQRLREHNLKIKLSKCKFAQKRVEYLSHIIENGSIKPNPAKVEAISKCKVPTTVKQVQSFLGLVCYYRKFINNCSTIASPLINLTKKNIDFIWDEACQSAFDQLKQILMSDQMLALPNYNKIFRLETDASGYGVGAVLSQQIDKQWKPIAYFSKHLSATERNYSTSERELLAIVLAIEKFKQYLYGREFIIKTDHKPLQFLLTTDVPSARLARLQQRIKWYDFKIEYKEGKRNGNADALSRLVLEEDKQCESFEKLDDEFIINFMKIKNNYLNEEQLKDDNLKWFYELKMHQNNFGSKPEINEFLNEEQRSLYKQWDRIDVINKQLYRRFVDNDDSIIYQFIVPEHQRRFVFEQLHDSVFAGHLGYDKTKEKLSKRFYWYKCNEELKQYIRECVECQVNKSPNRYNRAEMIPIRPISPFELITTDILGPLPVTENGNKYVLVVVDHFTKWVEFFPMKDQKAETVANNLLTVFCRHGMPDTILSDQGSNYESGLMNQLWEVLDIHKVRTTIFHAACDGCSERVIRNLQAMASNYVNENHNDWDILLNKLAFAYNSSVHHTTGASPFELVYGRQPKIPIDLVYDDVKLDLNLNEDYALKVQTQLANAFKQVRLNRDIQMNRHKVRLDRQVRAANLNVNDYVWFLNVYKQKEKSTKFCRRWTGPYRITKILNNVDYEIRPEYGGRKRIVHQSKLKKAFMARLNESDKWKQLFSQKTKQQDKLPNATLIEDGDGINYQMEKEQSNPKTNTNESNLNNQITTGEELNLELPIPHSESATQLTGNENNSNEEISLNEASVYRPNYYYSKQLEQQSNEEASSRPKRTVKPVTQLQLNPKQKNYM